jgi:hypothetical protein
MSLVFCFPFPVSVRKKTKGSSLFSMSLGQKEIKAKKQKENVR